MKIGIFTSFENLHFKVIDACKDVGVNYEVIDILSFDWIKNVEQSDCDGFFCSSTCSSQEKKTILDERYYFISKILNKKIYPSFDEMFIHENKRNMAAWLEINNFPHPKTWVFTKKQEVKDFLKDTAFPIVIKANLGSAGSKVRIIRSKRKARRIINKVFSHNKVHSIFNPGLIYNRKLKGMPIPDVASPQKDYLLVQEYKNIIHEWRIIKIGDSFFGHQKLLKGESASGSGRVGWIDPPKELLLLTKEICDKGQFNSMAVDILETKQGEYFVNELQSSFGSYNPSQMYIDGKPGRYRIDGNDFVFEEGYFNKNGSNNLRVKHFLEILSKEHKTPS